MAEKEQEEGGERERGEEPMAVEVEERREQEETGFAEPAEAGMDVDAPAEPATQVRAQAQSESDAQDARETESMLLPTPVPASLPTATAALPTSQPEDILVHPAPAPASSLDVPPLVHTAPDAHSESGDTELETPVSAHVELPTKPSGRVRIEVVDKDAQKRVGEGEEEEVRVHAPAPRRPSTSINKSTADRLAALRPLFDEREGWDAGDEFDLF